MGGQRAEGAFQDEGEGVFFRKRGTDKKDAGRGRNEIFGFSGFYRRKRRCSRKKIGGLYKKWQGKSPLFAKMEEASIKAVIIKRSPEKKRAQKLKTEC